MIEFTEPKPPDWETIPAKPGVYRWDRKAGDVLYVGIARSRRSSGATLRSRIRQHLTGNLSGSTLRRTLAAQMWRDQGWQPRETPSGRLWLGQCGERALSHWMRQNLLVSWSTHDEPRQVEEGLIEELQPPLNLASNKRRDSALSLARADLRAAASNPRPASITLYRPVGQAELDLIAESGWRAFPPRLEGQPIFYPVLNEPYATQIARDWNTRDPASGYVGYVLCFEIDAAFAGRYEEQQVGAAVHRELWVPAEELEEFNAHIAGRIHVIAEHRAPASPG